MIFTTPGGRISAQSSPNSKVVSGVVGAGFTALPKRYEWVELAIGEPAIAATYLYILWKYAFGPADRALFGKSTPVGEATLPNAGSPIG